MRVLMTTMQLDIGGAETHIIELSKALKKRGIDITVASNGGAYEKELKDAGIPHVKIPFHSKNPIAMLKAYKLLKQLIFKERFDIVHAHARIPAFLCSVLHKRYHFRFVTTAHWVFTTRFPYNLLTNWGERSLAVSDDIKAYLIDNYGIKPDNIRVTINGIDLEKFSPDTDCSDVASEFSLEENKRRIVYVSRMDEDRSFAAHRLIEAGEILVKEFDNLEIVIVGGGNDYQNIKAEADAINQKVNKRLIITTDSRTDINKFTASGEIFVGVSRAALEAMACEKPSIIAGNEGYIGIFDQDKLQISYDTNFCCRGCEQTTTEKLTDDIRKLLNAPREELERLGKFSHHIVAEHYSMKTMADDAIMMYISVIKNSLINEVSEEEFASIDNYLIPNPLRDRGADSDVIISGYYGFGNSGDDSILYAVVHELKTLRPDIRIVALSNTPKKTAKIYGIKSISRVNFFSILYHMRRTKLLISGGGSLIQNVTSNKSLAYYLFIINTAIKLKKKVMLYANGIGPLDNDVNSNAIYKVLNNVDLITLREPSSLEELKRFNITKPVIEVTADPAFNLFPADDSEVNELLSRSGLPENSKYCVMAMRPWKTMPADFAKRISQVCNYIKEKYDTETVFIKMQPTRDSKITDEIAHNTKAKSYVINDNLSSAQALGIIKNAEFVIGMRLHTLIYAAKCETPVIGLVYDPKITSIMKYMNQHYRVPIEDPNPLTLCRYIDEIIENRSLISSSLHDISNTFSEKALDNAKLALNLIED